MQSSSSAVVGMVVPTKLTKQFSSDLEDDSSIDDDPNIVWEAATADANMQTYEMTVCEIYISDRRYGPVVVIPRLKLPTTCKYRVSATQRRRLRMKYRLRKQRDRERQRQRERETKAKAKGKGKGKTKSKLKPKPKSKSKSISSSSSSSTTSKTRSKSKKSTPKLKSIHSSEDDEETDDDLSTAPMSGRVSELQLQKQKQDVIRQLFTVTKTEISNNNSSSSSSGSSTSSAITMTTAKSVDGGDGGEMGGDALQSIVLPPFSSTFSFTSQLSLPNTELKGNSSGSGIKEKNQKQQKASSTSSSSSFEGFNALLHAIELVEKEKESSNETGNDTTAAADTVSGRGRGALQKQPKQPQPQQQQIPSNSSDTAAINAIEALFSGATSSVIPFTSTTATITTTTTAKTLTTPIPSSSSSSSSSILSSADVSQIKRKQIAAQLQQIVNHLWTETSELNQPAKTTVVEGREQRCPYCHKKKMPQVSKFNWDRHLNARHILKCLRCEAPFYYFTRKENLLRHLMENHCTDEEKRKCRALAAVVGATATAALTAAAASTANKNRIGSRSRSRSSGSGSGSDDNNKNENENKNKGKEEEEQ